MKWKPATELEIWDLINSACIRMTLEQEKMWDMIKITPEKWTEKLMVNLVEVFG